MFDSRIMIPYSPSPPGIQFTHTYTPYGQWEALSQYIQAYLACHPLISDETKINILSFNAQYLTKIADCKKKLVRKKCIPISPFGKGGYSYQRSYLEDYLLHEGTLVLKKIWQNEDISFFSNSTYLSSLKLLYNFIHIKNESEIKRKFTKTLSSIDSEIKTHEKQKDPEDSNFKIDKKYFRLNVFFEINQQSSPEDVKKQLESFLKITRKVISKYSFSNTEYNNKVNNHLNWAITSPWIENNQCLISNTTFFKEKIACGGSTPTIQQAAKIYAKSVTYLNKPFYSNPTQKPSTTLNIFFSPLFPTNFEDLLKTTLKYLKLKGDIEVSESKQILLEGTASLIEGLFSLDIEHKCVSLGIFDLFYHSTQRIHHYVMQLYLPIVDNWTFENTIDLIIEEITLILTLIKPYSQGALESVIQNELVAPWPTPSLVRVNQGGMQSFMEIIHALIKANKPIDQDADFLYFDDIYFECKNFFIAFTEVQDTLEQNRINIHKISTGIQDYFNEKITIMGIQGIQLNALIIDLHSAPQLNRYKQQAHDVIKTLTHLQSHQMLRPDFVCVIDNTIGMWGSEEINTLLNTFSKEIENGELHFVIYRSSHKFDILGCDKFNGGSYIAYSKPESNFYKLLSQTPSSAVADHVDYQMYTHFYKHAQKSIRNYYKKITANTQALYEKMDKSLIFDPDKSKSSWIIKKEDPLTTYVEIKFPPGIKIDTFLSNVDPNLEYVHVRNSFGYRSTSLSSLYTSKYKTIRIAVGIEDEARLTQLANFLNKIFLDMNKIVKPDYTERVSKLDVDQ